MLNTFDCSDQPAKFFTIWTSIPCFNAADVDACRKLCGAYSSPMPHLLKKERIHLLIVSFKALWYGVLVVMSKSSHCPLIFLVTFKYFSNVLTTQSSGLSLNLGKISSGWHAPGRIAFTLCGILISSPSLVFFYVTNFYWRNSLLTKWAVIKAKRTTIFLASWIIFRPSSTALMRADVGHTYLEIKVNYYLG